MALRKIPLKLQPYLKDESSLAASDDQEDPAVETFQNRIREFMSRDRAMHDQVCQKKSSLDFLLELIWYLVGKSFCFVCEGLLKT